MPVSTECAAALLSFRYPSILGRNPALIKKKVNCLAFFSLTPGPGGTCRHAVPLKGKKFKSG